MRSRASTSVRTILLVLLGVQAVLLLWRDTPDRRTAFARIARLIEDPSAKTLSMVLTDRLFRSSQPSRVTPFCSSATVRCLSRAPTERARALRPSASVRGRTA